MLFLPILLPLFMSECLGITLVCIYHRSPPTPPPPGLHGRPLLVLSVGRLILFVPRRGHLSTKALCYTFKSWSWLPQPLSCLSSTHMCQIVLARVAWKSSNKGLIVQTLKMEESIIPTLTEKKKNPVNIKDGNLKLLEKP